MRNQFQRGIAALCYASGLLPFVRWWSRRSGPSLVILYYHRAAGPHLRRQWLYLRRHYRILPLEEALTQLQEPGQTRDRRTLLAITFDDGYADNYTQAYALASELQLPITIFLISGYTNCQNAFWWADRLLRVARVDRVEFEGQFYHLDCLEERKALAQLIDQRFCQAASATEREQFLRMLCELFGVPSTILPGEEPVPLLTWAEVREMQESGWVSFGAHTIHHPDLARLTDPAVVQCEVGVCREELEQQLGHAISTFAYPYGHLGDDGYSAVKEAGYTWAVTTSPGSNTRQSDPHLLQRRNADANMQVWEVAASAVGLWTFFVRAKKAVKQLTRLPRR